VSAQSERAMLILGRADLLTDSPRLVDDDVLTIARFPCAPAATLPRTVVLRWDQLGPVDLTSRTVDGQRSAHDRLHGAPLYDALRPTPAVRRLAESVARPHVHVGTAPLIYATMTAADDGLAVHPYHRVEAGPDDTCFIRTGDKPLRTTSIDNLTWLQHALDRHTAQAPSLNSHQGSWRKAFPGEELEYKYTLPPNAPIWELATDTLHTVHHGGLPGFTLKYHDEFQTWDFLNHLYEIRQPETERGYVSFIPASSGTGWRMKRKWFTTDAFARREQVTDLEAIDNLDDYVRDSLRLDAHRLPTFRRIRYDVNVESLATSHYYGIFYDRSQVEATHPVTLCQCEIEYCRSRSTTPPSQAEILAEIDNVADWVQDRLARQGFTTGRTYYSKLSFLRDLASGSSA
jgi:hypothetical protein